jgi:integral membrane sensor domain MASE1
VVLVAYTAGLVLAWNSFGADVSPSFFPPAGVTLAAMILTRVSYWPWIILAVLLAETAVDAYYGESWLGIAGFAAANAVEPVIGAALVLSWCAGRPDLRRRRDFLAFLAGGCLVGPIIGALIGGMTKAVKDGAPLVENVLRWWAGDSLGVLVVAVPILLWPKQLPVIKARPLETAAILGASGLLSWVAFTTQFQPSMLILPVLALAALRLDMLGAALASATMALVANFTAQGDLSTIAGQPLDSSMSTALGQARIAVWAVLALVIAQEASGRVNAMRRHESERRERLRLKSLSDLAQRLSAALTPHDVGSAVLEHVVNESGATAANIGLLSPDRTSLQWMILQGPTPHALERPIGESPMSESHASTDAVRTGKPVIIGTTWEYVHRYGSSPLPWWKSSTTQSLVSWPLTTGGEPIGVLVLMWSEVQPLDNVQQSYISTVATMVSQALVRSRLYADESAKAAVLQSAVLPSAPTGLAGLEVSVAYEPSNAVEGVGGDWYDVMTLDKGRTLIAVGDVLGHGLRAVEDMAQLRIAGRALANYGLSPAQLLAELNVFARRVTHGRFATMAVAIFDPPASTLSYAAAGHPPPLLRRSATGEVIQLDDALGPLLGPLRDVNFTDGQIRIDPDDVLVMYTDGLVERRGVDLDTGIARCVRAVRKWHPDQLSNAACAALAADLAPRPRLDDVCVVAVRFTSEPGSHAGPTV